jgi:hypothetical protein
MFMKGKDKGTIIISFIVLVLIVSLFSSYFAFLNAKHEIGKYNERVIENCLLLDCDIDFWGNVECRSLVSAYNLTNFSTDYIYINITAGKNET